MTPAQENELIRSVRSLKTTMSEIKDLILPIAPQKDEMLTSKQACKFLSFSDRKLRRFVAAGTIPYTKKGNRLIFSRNSLLKWLNQ